MSKQPLLTTAIFAALFAFGPQAQAQLLQGGGAVGAGGRLVGGVAGAPGALTGDVTGRVGGTLDGRADLVGRTGALPRVDPADPRATRRVRGAARGALDAAGEVRGVAGTAAAGAPEAGIGGEVAGRAIAGAAGQVEDERGALALEHAAETVVVATGRADAGQAAADLSATAAAQAESAARAGSEVERRGRGPISHLFRRSGEAATQAGAQAETLTEHGQAALATATRGAVEGSAAAETTAAAAARGASGLAGELAGTVSGRAMGEESGSLRGRRDGLALDGAGALSGQALAELRTTRGEGRDGGDDAAPASGEANPAPSRRGALGAHAEAEASARGEAELRASRDGRASARADVEASARGDASLRGRRDE